MTLVSGTRALWSLRFGLSLLPIGRTPSPRLPGGFSTGGAPTPSGGGKEAAKRKPENVTLLENLSLLGVDLTKARQRQPGVLRKRLTNEQGVARFLRDKGADAAVVAGVISRYPRAITRSVRHLEQRWALWRGVLASDAEVVGVVDRSPESFFRSSDNDNLERNLAFLSSLGLEGDALRRLLRTAPRTFSNSAQLNRQMVELLEDVGAELGLSPAPGSRETPTQFAVAVLRRNTYVLIRSTRRVRRNVETLRAELGLEDGPLLALLRGPCAEILDLSGDALERNLGSLRGKLSSLGCGEGEAERLVIAFPRVLYLGARNLNGKLDLLLRGGVTVRQVVEKPKVLDFSLKNLEARLAELQAVDYDFQRAGIAVLDLSQKRFDARMKRLRPPQEEGGRTLNLEGECLSK
ncbi:hypothetical protein NHX12_024256 [Muraenolepis orangiensis]|uniref:Transcription termination factor 1, mitochondrial n=1 Tax=Muraenolepis orangiensis TaxID=630683 RepID=A0A9Q0ITG0_9TELE|nr:hypothetical protein NHX12_024256 [Muraenolepis orangiensis]